MFLYLKVILNVPYGEMDKMQRTNDANIVQYLFGELVNGILTHSTFPFMASVGLF